MLNYFVANNGLGLQQEMTLPKLFRRTALRYASKEALLEKREGCYQPMTYEQLLDRSVLFAASLIRHGLSVQDRTALLMKNSPDWVTVDLGTLSAGGVTVPIYETLHPSAICHILRDSGAKIVVVENRDHCQKILSSWAQLPDLQLIIVRNPVRNPEGMIFADRVVRLEDFLERGRAFHSDNPEAVENRLSTVKSDDLASIIYTSGTTGVPKGVMLTHRNFLSNIFGVLSVTRFNSDERVLSFLPLSHAFERTVGHYVPILMGCTIAYSEGFEKIPQNLREIRPTLCCSVPRLFEKIYSKIVHEIENSSRLRRKIFAWALGVGRRIEEAGRRSSQGLGPQGLDRRRHHRPEDRTHRNPLRLGVIDWLSLKIAEILVFRKIRAKLGGRLRYFVSGGAPLSPELAQFFHHLRVPIYEGYGMTETSPIISFNYDQKFRSGSVGKLLPNVEVMLSPEGEILVRGPNVMKGYYNNPSATSETIDAQGWLHTGDIGIFDEENYLRITDRIKELIVMSNGKKVPPAPIENRLTQSPWIAHATVVGNNRRYITALLFPNVQAIYDEARRSGLLEANRGLADLCGFSEVREKFERHVDEINRGLSRYEQIKDFEIVPYELGIDTGELTPTLKVKRRVVEEKFAQVLDRLYSKEPSSGVGTSAVGTAA